MKTSLTGYELTQRLRKARRRYPLTATEQALFHELIAICNDQDWDDVFNCSNHELCAALQITEKTLIHSRTALIKAGVLFHLSGKSRRQFGKYSFTVELTPVKIPVEPTVDVPVDTTVDKGVDTAITTVKFPDYIKEKKTKLREGLVNPFSESFAEHWVKWIEYKKLQFKFTYKVLDSEQTALNTLVNLSKNNEANAIKIIEQSLINGWKGLFELKTPVLSIPKQQGFEQLPSRLKKIGA